MAGVSRFIRRRIIAGAGFLDAGNDNAAGLMAAMTAGLIRLRLILGPARRAAPAGPLEATGDAEAEMQVSVAKARRVVGRQMEIVCDIKEPRRRARRGRAGRGAEMLWMRKA